VRSGRFRRWRLYVLLLATIGGGSVWIYSLCFHYGEYWNPRDWKYDRYPLTWYLLGHDDEEMWDIYGDTSYPPWFTRVSISEGYLWLEVVRQYHGESVKGDPMFPRFRRFLGVRYRRFGPYPSFGNPPELFGVVLAVQIPYMLGLLWVWPAVRGFRTVCRWRKKRCRWRRGECLECGYSLVGNISGTCPECGLPIPEDVKETTKQKPDVANSQDGDRDEQKGYH